MQGGVYSIRIQGHFDSLPHPHVVLLEFEHDCWLVPGFSSGGNDLEERLALHESMGLHRDIVSVELDNSVYVQWVRGYTGKLSRWCIWRHDPPIPKKVITASPRIGQMSELGMLSLFECMKRLMDARTPWFAKKRMKRVREMIDYYRRLTNPI